MDFKEMEELARAPQERVNFFVIDKLESIEAKTADCVTTIQRHNEDITGLKTREARRAWQGKVIWLALATSVGALVERLFGGRQ